MCMPGALLTVLSTLRQQARLYAPKVQHVNAWCALDCCTNIKVADTIIAQHVQSVAGALPGSTYTSALRSVANAERLPWHARR